MTPTLTLDRCDLLGAVMRERVYRTHKGTIVRQVRNGTNRRCDVTIRAFVDAGWVTEPPEGASFFEITDAGYRAYQTATGATP